MFVLIVHYGTAYACEGKALELVCTDLVIADLVSTKSKYPAVMKCSGLDDVKVLYGEFYWSNEGPFKIKKSKVDKEEGEVLFYLRTRNSGSYKIDGEIHYKNCQKKRLKTGRITAGYIRAK